MANNVRYGFVQWCNQSYTKGELVNYKLNYKLFIAFVRPVALSTYRITNIIFLTVAIRINEM